MTCKIRIQVGDRDYALLTWTEDMACWSWSLPAMDSCPMAKADEPDDICSSCYAMINRYGMAAVLNSQWARFTWTKQMLESNPDYWVGFMTDAIKLHSSNDKRFRGHDSGDFFSPVYIEAWTKVCKALPNIKFWFPTRSWRATSAKWREPFAKLANLKNVTVRPSALKFNSPAPKIPGFSKGTTVCTLDQAAHFNVCPKTQNGGSCESNKCFACWENRKEVAYIVHGRMGRNTPSKASDKELANRKRFASQFVGLTINVPKKELVS